MITGGCDTNARRHRASDERCPSDDDLSVDEQRLEAMKEGRLVPSPEQIACGITHAAWRAGLETVHGRFGDAEMAYMNIATTLALVEPCINGIDWERVRAVLLDSERAVLPSRSASSALGEEWNRVVVHIEELVADLERRSSLAPAIWAELMCHGWWGMPDYDAQVVEFLEQGVPSRWQGTKAELATALRSRPLDVPIEVWEQIVGGNGLGWLDR